MAKKLRPFLSADTPSNNENNKRNTFILLGTVTSAAGGANGNNTYPVILFLHEKPGLKLDPMAPHLTKWDFYFPCFLFNRFDSSHSQKLLLPSGLECRTFSPPHLKHFFLIF